MLTSFINNTLNRCKVCVRFMCVGLAGTALQGTLLLGMVVMSVSAADLVAPHLLKSDKDANELVQQLQLLKTFNGQFQQSLVDENGVELQDPSTGKFWLQRPGYFHWQTEEPFPQVLTSDLQTIWLYDPDLEQVTIKPYDQRLSQTPALLLGGDVDEIKQHYVVEKIDDAKSAFRLTPKPQEASTEQPLFSELWVEFERGQLSAMRLKDTLSQTTTFRFIDGVYNEPINPDRFEFTPPEGTDVIVGN